MQKLLVPKGMRPNKSFSLWLSLAVGFTAPLAAQINYATPYDFTILAGLPGNAGSTDGTGTTARFNHPYGLAIDSSGNLYVADRSNDLIRKVTPAGVVTTLAGTAGVTGYTDATGTAAVFDQPGGVAVDSNGNVYVADTINDVIRKITSAGVVTTLAGTAGTPGDVDATGVAATFNSPFGIAVDGSGNVYVADSGNSTIRKITSAGVVTTVAGMSGITGSNDATGTAATFNNPVGIAVDSSGNLYVADTGNNAIRMITSGGVVSTLAGNPAVAGTTDGTGIYALFRSPRGIAVDGSGNLFVADSQNSTIRKVTAAGVVTTLAGTPGDFSTLAGTGAAALFDIPFGVAVGTSGTVFVTTELGYAIEQGSAVTALAPAITLQPSSQTISNGSTVVFRVLANGLPLPSYQWYFNGNALSNGAGVSGATAPTLVINAATAANAGVYSCAVVNASGTATSGSATLAVITTANVGRLVNISCRSQVGLGNNILIAGFAVGGAGTSGSQSLLIRGSGPALGVYGITGTLPDPQLEFFTGSALTATNYGWAGNAQVAAAITATSAFPWTDPSSLDSALVESLTPGTYTAQVNGKSGDTGIALAEVYDDTPAGTYTPSTPRLINISARAQVGTGSNVMIAGFVIGGATSRTVLIRASGPALAPYLSGSLLDPELKLFSGSALLATNDGWGGDSEIATAAAAVGAFTWSSPSSGDSAILVTLPPGSYTAQVSGASGDSGLALIEVYEVQ